MKTITKENLINALHQIDFFKTYKNEDWFEFQAITEELYLSGFNVGFDFIEGDNPYILATYYSPKLKRSIIIERNVSTPESKEEMVDLLYNLNLESITIEESIKVA